MCYIYIIPIHEEYEGFGLVSKFRFDLQISQLISEEELAQDIFWIGLEV